MSQDNKDYTAAKRATIQGRHTRTPYMMVIGDPVNGAFLGGAEVGADTDISGQLRFVRKDAGYCWIGFSFQVPLACNAEDSGFGVRHFVDARGGGVVKPTDVHEITVRLPADSMQIVCSPLPPMVQTCVPEKCKNGALVEVTLPDATEVCIDGLQMPFYNPGHQFERWLDNKPVAAGKTLMEILQSTKYKFIVTKDPAAIAGEWKPSTLPAPFEYPWGTEHHWDEDWNRELAELNRGCQFPTSWWYRTTNSHVAVLSQAISQDIQWIADAANTMKGDQEHRFRAYFTERFHQLPLAREYDVEITPSAAFWGVFDEVWRHLAKDNKVQLRLFEHRWDDTFVAFWKASIVGYPQGNNVDLREWAAFDFDVDISDHIRKFNAVCMFTEGSLPSNPQTYGARLVDSDGAMEGEPQAVAQVKKGMEIARAVVCGRGFHGVSFIAPSAVVPPVIRLLPVVNMIAGLSERELTLLLGNVLPEDRFRFRQYLKARPLGIGLVTAGPGFGKTTMLAVAAYAMIRSLSTVYISGPTHVSVDNIAARIDTVSGTISKAAGRKDPVRRLMIVRGYKMEDEIPAFKRLLRRPDDGDRAIPSWRENSPWKLHLSVSYWLLMALRSPAVRSIEPEDCPAIHELQRDFDGDERLASLRAVATGAIAWEEYQEGELVTDAQIRKLLEACLGKADAVATTPALSTQSPWLGWKNTKGKGIVVDEAGCISRPDFYCVWGNTMTPVFLAGDEKQLPPTVLTLLAQVREANEGATVFRNRHALDLKISALEFLKASGWPVFRLRTQLRMANDLFRLSHSLFYSDVPYTYGQQSLDIQGAHASGLAMEEFLQANYSDLRRPPHGRLQGAFIHCKGPGAKCTVDQFTGSRLNPGQNRTALHLLSGFVQAHPVAVSQIVILTPYKANAQLIAESIEGYENLKGLETATVDSFQGREADIVVVVMTTTEKSGPGFTTDEQRLNVMLSRQRSFLLLVGDINVTGRVDKAPGRAGRGQTALAQKFEVIDAEGNSSWVKATALRNAMESFWNAWRVATVTVD